MSKIEQLIAELCPQGVRHYKLGDTCGYSSTRISAQELDTTTFVGVDNLLPNKGGRVNSTYSANSTMVTKFAAGDVLLGNIRPYLKKVWLADREGGCSGDVLAVRIKPEFQSEILPAFLYYLLSSEKFFEFNMKHAKGAKMPRGSKSAILYFRIPVPPLEVQREIVKILDAFTQLEAELEAELEARRKQYEHYRDSLLSFPDAGGVRWVPMGEVVRIRNGSDHKSLGEGEYPVYGSGGVMRHADSFVYDKPSVLIPRKGSLGNLFFMDTPFWTVDTIFYTEINDELIVAKYLFHFLKTADLASMNKAGGVPSMTQSELNRLKVPLPELNIQQQIVAILDAFDALVNDISIGLPAEIAARRKQYEFYRDKLLTFKEAA